MADEIERKFLVTGDGWQSQATASHDIVQAYLTLQDTLEIRVRIIDGQRANLTLKSAKAELSRREFEYEIPVADAHIMIGLRQGRCIRKRRHLVPRANGSDWEVDVFEGDHDGLCLAEVEFQSREEGLNDIDCPDWLGREVTGVVEYSNAALAQRR